MADQKLEYLLRLADTAMVLSQRLSEWCGKGPALEEDMALTNVALDLIGQARFWYTYAGEIEGKGRDEDKLAYLRDAHDFRNLLLVEQPNGTYADTLARQFYFDVWHFLLLRELAASKDERIAGIAGKSIKEVAYHVRRSSDLIVRLGDGTEQSHEMMQQALDDLWMYTGEMFKADAVEQAMAEQGIGPDLASLREPWLKHVSEVFDEATLKLPPVDAWMQKGGKQGVHTEHLGYLLAEMQFLQRAYPGASW
ncbi:1,2-phenylacetyl-CoA epoxidase subunit PaaC [Noviherbaspirillum malthae]|uniref:1,2-phenylacetyl-CoA epoxidase subunit PaaC n=1 Tax=Noviherbaspirillum malthae TaxID=1260987 RepID=UPI00188FFD37|nr:1,2-phenylacetyl-CoA epoxidase subunit PaaC [Noviherbaspirillum malthae]